MTQFNAASTQRADFNIPFDGSKYPLTGWSTRHKQTVRLAHGVWEYEVKAFGVNGNDRGLLRVKIKTGGHWIEKRVKISPGSKLTNSICVARDGLEVDVIFSRGFGTAGVRYLCQFRGPSSERKCEEVKGDSLPPFWFWGRESNNAHS